MSSYWTFSKTFNLVPHNRLLYKLENYGIKGETLRWIKAFLENPQQSVVVDDERSVFQAYVNNLLRNIRSRVHLFVDYTIL